ncbi:MAG: hypothetical protein K2X86_14570 [Cytophagaceae bacterium]|nr:hypothetical protein [Cytophagaceae bacterium]
MYFPPYIHTDLINSYEYLLAVPYLCLMYAFAYVIRANFYKNSPLKKYFFPALTVKLIGAVGVTMVYNYYYKGGDTCIYFNYSKYINSLLLSNPEVGLRLLFSEAGNFAPELWQYVLTMEYAYAESSYIIVKMAAFLQLFTLQSYLITAMLFGLISFFAIWKMYVVFCSYYPQLSKQFAIAFLFIPSVFFWGSGILKDTVCFASLALLFTCIHGLFFKGENKLINFIGIIITGYIITIVKAYIIISFASCVIILILLHYRNKISNKNIRLFITPIFVFGAAILSIFLIQFINENSVSNIYTVDQILTTSEITRQYIYASGGGSSYSLGEIDNSLFGLLKAFPAGVNVTLFRPYLWEAHNFIALIASIEGLFILLLTISTIYKSGFVNFFKTIASTNIIFFCIVFSLIFAYAVGISSYNFGTLVRYKIPCIPFYVAGIQMIAYVSKIKEKNQHPGKNHRKSDF